MGNYLRKPETSKELAEGENSFLKYGVAAMQGWRLHMEDAHTVVLDIDEMNSCAFGVFDGHGGSEVAKFSAMYYIAMLQDSEYYVTDIQRAIRETFLMIDNKINSEKQRIQLQRLENKKDDGMEDLQEAELQNAGITIKPEYRDETKNSNNEELGEIYKGTCPFPQADLQPTVVEKKFDNEDATEEKEDKEQVEKDVKESNQDDQYHSQAFRVEDFIKMATNKNFGSTEDEQLEKNVSKVDNTEVMDQVDQEKNDDQKENTHQLTLTRMGQEDGEKSQEEEKQEEDKIEVDKKEQVTDGLLKEEEPKEAKDQVTDTNMDQQGGDRFPNCGPQALYDDLNALEESPRERQEYIGPVAGCTVNFAFLRDHNLYVANIGDSRSVLSRQGQALALSFDHKPELQVEIDRIKKAGGFIIEGRINGSLNLSRALGDAEYKQNQSIPQEEQIISPEPDMKHVKINEQEDEFMIVACDGIWDSFTNQDAIDYIRSRLIEGQEPQQICKQMCDECLAPGVVNYDRGCDNMSVIIVVFSWALQKFAQIKMEQLYQSIPGRESMEGSKELQEEDQQNRLLLQQQSGFGDVKKEDDGFKF